MAFRVLYDDITYTFLQNSSKMGEWNQQMSAIADSLNMFLGMESFQGTTAESVKNYLADVHFTILVSLGEVLSEFQSRFLLYKEGYYSEIDGDIHAELTEETLDSLIAFLPQSEQGFVSQHSALTSVSNTISDLMGAAIPSDFYVLDSYSTVLKRVKDLKENTGTYEITHHGSDLQNFQDLLAAVKAFINDYLAKDAASILNYQAGNAVNMGSFSTLENAIINAYNTRASLSDELLTAGENEAARMEILEAEWAKQREEAGMWQWIAGAGAVIVGTICIVATAGCATPLVVAGFVAGGSAVAYGAAEMYEGEQEMYYGSIGDPYTSSFNPIRDTIFRGNQEAYDTWGFISTTAAGILIPVGQGYQAAIHAATNVGGSATRQAITQSIMYEVGKDAVSSLVGIGATQLGAHWGSEWFGEDVGKWIGIGSGVLAGFASNAAIGRLNKIYNWSGVQPPIRPVTNQQQFSINSNYEDSSWKVTESYTAEDANLFWANQGYDVPPYKPGTEVAKVELVQETTFVRVFDGDIAQQHGGWIMRPQDIEGLSAGEIKDLFSLEYEPRFITDVTLPAGTTIETGVVNGVSAWNTLGGGIQFDMLGQRLGEFTNIRPIK